MAKKITLNLDLEKALLKAIIEGLSPASLLASEELSKDGKHVLRAFNYLVANGGVAPFLPSAVLITAKSLGADGESIRAYLRSFQETKYGKDVDAIITAARNKEALVNLVNEAAEQLNTGSFDLIKLTGVLEKTPTYKSNKPESLAEKVKDGFPSPPTGHPIRSLPSISSVTNGLQGIWVLGGEPGLGKTTLAQQIALDVGQDIPVLYYDEDGTGEAWFIHRIRRIVGDEAFRNATRRFHLRDSVRSLEVDLSAVKPPALIIIDSIQTLPTSIIHRRSSLDKWLIDFKHLSKKGYTLLLVSEIGRGSYGEVRLGAFKESGEIEYAGHVCCQLSGDPEDEDAPTDFYITKNRHGTRRGRIVTLERDEDKVFWFREGL